MAEGSEPLDELVDHVDEDGNVIEVVTRSEMRRRTLRHRCTYVFVVRPSGGLVVHRRADWKSIYPGWWDCAFGGVCGAGEDWQPAAARELAEEAGVSEVDLEELGPLRYDADDGHIVGRAFVVVTDAVVDPVDGEVVEIDEIPIVDIDSWMLGRSVSLDTRIGALPLLMGSDRIRRLVASDLKKS